MMNELTRNQCKVTNHQVNVQFLVQLQPEWQRFVTLVKQSQELKHVSYHKLYDIMKQHQHEVNEIRAEKIARHSSTKTHQAATRNRVKAIVNSPQPIYDQEPSIVDDDEDTSKDKEIDKLMALISLSFKKIYKPTNNNLRTSSNTSCTNQDNSPRIHRNAGYKSQRSGTVAGARDTVGSSMVQKSGIQCNNCKEYRHVARESGIQLNAEQADWKDDTDDESNDQELEAHYMYMAKIQQVSPDVVDSRPIFDKETEQKVQNDDHYDVFTIECQHPEQFESVHKTYLTEQDAHNVLIESEDMNYDSEQIDQNDEDADLAKELLSMLPKWNLSVQKCLNEDMVADLKYFNSLELEVYSLRSQLETQKTQFLNEIDRLSREYYYADYMNAILGVYTELDKVTNLQCDYLELLEKCECLETELSKSKLMSKSFETLQKHAINLEIDLQQCQEKIKNDKSLTENMSKEFRKEHEQYFEIQDLKAQLQDKGIVISELKKLIEKLKGKSVDTKFEKSSVIRQLNAFKSQRPSVLGKPITFLNSFVRKDFSKPKSVTQNNVSNDFSKPVTAQTLPSNKKSILKNTNVLALGMYKIHIESNQTRTSQLPRDSRKTNKHVSFSTRVIPTTSVSRPQHKSNPMGDIVLHNNSQGKKQDVKDHHRSVKFSKNKTSVTACNDSLNPKTLNVNSVCATCDTCVLNEKHDICVFNSVAKPFKKTVAPESNQKPRNINRKLYKRISKACSWWYPKFTPSGYKWKPKSGKEIINPNTSMPPGSVSRTANILEYMTSRCFIVSNTPLYSNSFAARRDCPIHHRLWVLKAHDRKSQASN
nr:hypothetical protein [Tanacetum cinerariifolium]